MMRYLLIAISQYRKKHGRYPRIQMNPFFYHATGNKLSHLDVEITNEVETWALPDAEPVEDYCCGSYSSEAGCCGW